MKLTITARHFKAKESLQNYIKEKINELSKYNENILFADVILSSENSNEELLSCEIILKMKEKILTAKETNGDSTKVFDKVFDKIESQLYKYMDKIKNKKYNKENLKIQS
jgi:ribosomal subunit interface protein